MSDTRLNRCWLGKLTLLVVLVSQITFISGCQPNTADSRQPKLILTFPNKTNYEPLIIAAAQQAFDKNGLKVDVQVVTGGIQAAEAMATGATTIAALGDAPAVIALARDLPYKIVARYAKAKNVHKVMVGTSITTIEELKGKRMGIQLGSSTHGGLMQWLAKHGLSNHDIRLVSMNPLDFPDAMATGQIDAMAGSEPWPTNVKQRCLDQVVQLGDFSQVGNDFPHVIMVHEKLIQDHPTTIKAFLSSLAPSIDLLTYDPQQAAAMVSPVTGLAPSRQQQLSRELIWSLGWEAEDLAGLKQTADFLLSMGKIDKLPNWQQSINLSFLDEQVMITNRAVTASHVDRSDVKDKGIGRKRVKHKIKNGLTK